MSIFNLYFLGNDPSITEIWGSMIFFCSLITGLLFFIIGLLGSLALIRQNWKWIFLSLGFMFYGALSAFICVAPLAGCVSAVVHIHNTEMSVSEFSIFCMIMIAVMTMFAIGRKSVVHFI